MDRGKLPPAGGPEAVLPHPSGPGHFLALHQAEGGRRKERPGARSAGGGTVFGREPALPRSRGGTNAITTRETLIQCARLAQEKKAADIRALDVHESATFTDYFLLCSGTSDRQVTAVANHIEESLRKEGVRPLGIEGIREGRWVLIDYGDLVVHVFLDSVREFYKFDRLWGSAAEIPIPEAG